MRQRGGRGSSRPDIMKIKSTASKLAQGDKRGRLLILGKAFQLKKYRWYFVCKCDCGDICVIESGAIQIGHTQSCGCMQKEAAALTGKRTIKQVLEKRITHGESKTQLYTNWKAMRRRCLGSKTINYKYYCGKGIRVCDEWKDFSCFKQWAIDNGWAPGLTVDRLDPDNNYSPENCQIVSKAENTKRMWQHKKLIQQGQLNAENTSS